MGEREPHSAARFAKRGVFHGRPPHSAASSTESRRRPAALGALADRCRMVSLTRRVCRREAGRSSPHSAVKPTRSSESASGAKRVGGGLSGNAPSAKQEAKSRPLSTKSVGRGLECEDEAPFLYHRLGGGFAKPQIKSPQTRKRRSRFLRQPRTRSISSRIPPYSLPGITGVIPQSFILFYPISSGKTMVSTLL